jgi:alanine racemase
MDIVIADVSGLGDRVAPGDEAVLLGDQHGARIRAADFAAWAGVSEYEVTCGMSKRVPRVYR